MVKDTVITHSFKPLPKNLYTSCERICLNHIPILTNKCSLYFVTLSILKVLIKDQEKNSSNLNEKILELSQAIRRKVTQSLQVLTQHKPKDSKDTDQADTVDTFPIPGGTQKGEEFQQ